jgi:hypothetical protein
MAEEILLHNEKFLFDLNKTTAKFATQFSIQTINRPALPPELIWAINLLLHNEYMHGAFAYLGMHIVDKVTDGAIGALLGRAVAVGDKLLGHVRKTPTEPVSVDTEREVDSLTDAFRTILVSAKEERLNHALAEGQQKAIGLLIEEYKLPMQKAEAITKEHATEIAQWVRAQE